MFINVFNQVAILFILILLGAVLSRAKIITKNGAAVMTDICLTVVTPCVIIKSFMREFTRDSLNMLLTSFLLAFLSHLLFIIISRAVTDKDKSRERVLQFAAVFSNCGFMAIPLQQAILGDEGVFIGSAFIAIFNLFTWSYGIILMSGDKKYLSPKKLVLNPGIIGLAIGLVIFFFSLPIPSIASEPVSYLAALNTPLPMMIIGFHLSESNPFSIFKDIKALLVIALRLAFLPAVAIALMYLGGIRGTMLVSTAISCCAPTAATTTMFASKFGADTSLSVSIVSLSTLMSLITIPLAVTIAQIIS